MKQNYTFFGTTKRITYLFGRSDKWDIIGGEAKLENGEIIIVNMDNTDAKMKFLCVPTGWGNP